MSKQPDQAIFDEIYKQAAGLGVKVCLELPDAGTPYPFIVMGETQLVPIPTKSYLLGLVSVTVHVWGTIKQRKVVSDLLGGLMAKCGDLNSAAGYQVAIQSSDSRLIKDQSTLETLYHGLLDLDFYVR